MTEHERLRLRSRVFGDPIDWVVRHAPCDVLLVDNRGYDEPERVELAGDGGLFNPETVAVADSVATENDSEVFLWYPTGNGDAEQRKCTIETYQDEIADLLSVPVQTAASVTSDPDDAVPEVRVRKGADPLIRGALFDEQVVPPSDRTEISVHVHESEQPSFLRRLIERSIF